MHDLERQMLQWLVNSDEKAEGRTVFEDVDQYELTLGQNGALTIPAILLEKLGWLPGHRLLLEQTDDGVLVTEIEAPGGANADL